MNDRLHAIGHRIAEDAIKRQGALDTEQEATKVAQSLAISAKPRSVPAYEDVADYLLTHYDPFVAYFVAVNIDIQMRPTLGYIPIGQIVLAIEQTSHPDRVDKAADLLACALLNLGNIEMARQAFTVYKAPAMKDRVATRLRSYDSEVAAYIVG